MCLSPCQKASRGIRKQLFLTQVQLRQGRCLKTQQDTSFSLLPHVAVEFLDERPVLTADPSLAASLPRVSPSVYRRTDFAYGFRMRIFFSQVQFPVDMLLPPRQHEVQSPPRALQKRLTLAWCSVSRPRHSVSGPPAQLLWNTQLQKMRPQALWNAQFQNHWT